MNIEDSLFLKKREKDSLHKENEQFKYIIGEIITRASSAKCCLNSPQMDGSHIQKTRDRLNEVIKIGLKALEKK